VTARGSTAPVAAAALLMLVTSCTGASSDRSDGRPAPSAISRPVIDRAEAKEVFAAYDRTNARADTAMDDAAQGQVQTGVLLKESLGDEVVLAARPSAVDRAGTAFGPRRAACTWEESITARDQSSFPAARSFFNSTRCSASHTTGLVPRGQTPPARHPRTEAQLLWQVLPLDTGVQHEQDPAQGLPIRYPRSPLHQLRTRLGQQRLDERPQFIRHDPRPRLTLPHDQANDHPSRNSHDQRLLLGPLSLVGVVLFTDAVLADVLHGAVRAC